jgi:hypothetical protein
MIDAIREEIVNFFKEEKGNRVTVYNIEGLIVRLTEVIEAQNVDKTDRSHNPEQ